MLAVVQTNGDELADAGDRHSKSGCLRHQRQTLELHGPKGLQLFRQQPLRGEIGDQQGQVTQIARGVHGTRSLQARWAMSEQLH